MYIAKLVHVARTYSTGLLLSLAAQWSRLVCSVLVNSNTLTVNYGVKQSQFTKPTSEPRASDPEESNEAFDARAEDCDCSITVANHQLITVIRFVVKSYTHP